MEERIVPIDLSEWNPTDDEKFFEWVVTPDCFYVRAKYEELLGLVEGTSLPCFDIKRLHFKKVMEDVVKHMNYFLNFYDVEHNLFTSIMSVKFIIDQKHNIKPSAIMSLTINRVITDDFLDKVQKMTDDLYSIDIDNSSGTSYANTPKITNEQAKQLVMLSFCYRMVYPLLVHYVNNNSHFKNLKDYIPFFDKLFMKIVHKVEKRGVSFYYSLCRFIAYRCDRQYNANRGTWAQKKQLYGSVLELYIEEIIHEVILVKSLHKLNYNRSVVSFIDGVLFKYALNFRRENFKAKPYEVDSTETQSDGDDYLSHVEALEMAVYQIDESNAIINEVNNSIVLKRIHEKFPIRISDEEYKFYYENCKINAVTQYLLDKFYSKYFDSADSIYAVPLDETIRLMIIAKKWFQMKGLSVIPQLFTATIQGKYKDNAIKNSKFVEMITSSDIWKDVLVPRYRYIEELEGNYDSVLKKFSIIVNSTFITVDFEPEANGLCCSDIDVATIADEVLFFMSIT